MSEERPVWRQGFDAVEAAVGPRVKAVVASEPFAVAVGIASRAQHTVQQRIERTTRRLLHLANLPAGSDVDRILVEIAQLQRQIVNLTRQLDGAKVAASPNRARR